MITNIHAWQINMIKYSISLLFFLVYVFLCFLKYTVNDNDFLSSTSYDKDNESRTHGTF